MPLDGVIPEVGDLVKRGEHLAGVGVVGVSSGPHLHFATRTQPKPGGTTFLARFEALVWIPLDLGPEILNYCYVPAELDILRSNNKPFP